MVLVEGGAFTMGCTPEQYVCQADEKPAHRMEIASVEIGAFELTQELWLAVLGETRAPPVCGVPGRDGQLG